MGGWPVVAGDAWNDSNFSWLNAATTLEEAGYSVVDDLLEIGMQVDFKNNTRYLAAVRMSGENNNQNCSFIHR